MINWQAVFLRQCVSITRPGTGLARAHREITVSASAARGQAPEIQQKTQPGSRAGDLGNQGDSSRLFTRGWGGHNAISRVTRTIAGREHSGAPLA